MTQTPPQIVAASSESPLTLAIAGPGSGKTATLVSRIRRLVDSGQDPRGFVVITFTNAAANELRGRLSLGSAGDLLGYCGTLHGYLLSLITRRGGLIGFSGRPTVLSEEQAQSLLDQVCREQNYKGTKEALEAEIALGPTVSPKPLLIGKSKARVVALDYSRRLQQGNLLTFDTILHNGLRLVRKIGHDLGTHLFVDEFQDSSLMDAAIYKALPFPFKFYVGDPDQAIYGFRGGDVGNILGLAETTECKTVLLEQNFRSDFLICQAAQKLIEHNKARSQKKTVSVSARMGIVGCKGHRSPLDEASWIAARLSDLDPEQSAVLVRTNHLVRTLSAALESRGVMVAKRESKKRPQDWKICRALVALLNDPENDLLARWYLELSRGEETARAASIKAAASGISINSFYLRIPKIELEDLPEVLAKAGIGRESTGDLSKAIADLPPGSTIGDLVLFLAQEEQAGQQVGQGVTVTTMHSAKGREWDNVFMPAFEQETIPGTANIEEERRLAYVGMTRARHRLFLSWCEHREPAFTRGFMPVTPSQFIKEAL